MTSFEITYFALSLTGLAVLCTIVWQMGAAMADCPATGRAAKAGALTILTGFAAIGAGIVALVAALFPILTAGGLSPLYTALGFTGIALGIGFTFAAGRLQAVVLEAANRATQPADTMSHSTGITGTEQAPV
ncbi:hypothetical protein [Algicella marina]|uniref:Uncharacterized protein n=1 Tax=Algicella marina TaxID=2683284 RepID=A0A6P1T5S3_9RHOB|nr:hypothetical protein [Algicella marina]QHQ37161.1 hypothetical protein GO499_19220 [Algicella marina]